jgi:hypothetical protein
MGNVESGVQTLYCGLGITFMLGGAAAAYVKRLQSRVSDQEKALSDFKVYVAKHYTSQDFLNDLKREIADSLRVLAGSRVPSQPGLRRRKMGPEIDFPIPATSTLTNMLPSFSRV